VQVKAFVVTVDRADAKLERIVGRLSLDPNIVAASWRAASIADDEEALATDPG
jgi:hypothetical protein